MSMIRRVKKAGRAQAGVRKEARGKSKRQEAKE
jgi:hypothetical protein